MTIPTIALVGGGVSTVALLEELARTLSAERLRLRVAAQDHPRVRSIVRHGRHILEGRPGWRLEASRSVAEAIEGAAVVVLMLRVGGLDARRADELLAQRFGLPGDEGLGAGGAANALRTLSVLDDLGADLTHLAPDATVLNLVAPLGLTTRVLLDRGLDAIGVCELPGATEHALASALGGDTRLAYSGFNHLGWFWPVDAAGDPRVDAADILEPAVTAGHVDRAVLSRFEAVPLKYFYWLHDPEAAARLGIARDPNRSDLLIDLRDQVRADLMSRPDVRPAAMVARPTPWFREALVPMIEALMGGTEWRGFANVRNGPLVPLFDPDLIVEVPARLSADGLTPDGQDGPMPAAALAFSRRVERSEQLLHAAWQDEDPGLVERSLVEGPHDLDEHTAHELTQALCTATGFATVRLERATLTRTRRKDPTLSTMRFLTSPTTATDYVVGPDAWQDAHLLGALGNRPVVAVVDEQVARHHAPAVSGLLAGIDCVGRLEIRGGEQCKSQRQLDSLLAWFEACELPKHGVVMAIGGGTVSDVVGLAAMLIRRSVALVILPTTLLAQVDAAVGGKNGINSPTTKNVIGHFHHPLVVASDPRLLTTIDRRQVVSGIAECIKVFAVADGDALERHGPTLLHPGDAGPEAWGRVVTDAQHHKLRLLADDPYEESSRRLLNYGHAFAHMLEERSDYQLLHGEAVLFGMLIENEVSKELGIASDEVDVLQQVIVDLVPDASRDHWVPFDVIGPDLDKVRQMRRAAMNLVCLEAPGRAVVVDDAADEVLATAWRRVEERLRVTLSQARALT